MSPVIRYSVIGGALVAGTILALACSTDSHPTNARQLSRMEMDDAHTMGSGTSSKLLGRATFSDGEENLKIKRITGDWHVEIKAKEGISLAVQSITFFPGGQSGWHRHPGPVFIQVVKGEMTFYDSQDPTCTPMRRKAGEGFLDLGEHAHIARNESGADAENVVTYFAPPGVDLKIDAPKPGNCPF